MVIQQRLSNFSSHSSNLRLGKFSGLCNQTAEVSSFDPKFTARPCLCECQYESTMNKVRKVPIFRTYKSTWSACLFLGDLLWILPVQEPLDWIFISASLSVLCNLLKEHSTDKLWKKIIFHCIHFSPCVKILFQAQDTVDWKKKLFRLRKTSSNLTVTKVPCQ